MLYQKYRPGKFAEVIGQGLTPEVLRLQVQNKTIGHSYLLTGNRGSGKTTTARILAAAINCEDSVNGEPCGKCKSCQSFLEGNNVDIIEVDAASNNGVDHIRNMISSMQYYPQIGKYKVYIIDEAHMLTMGASNAFLKTLEEPPEHVVLILATTDPQKLPITVLSRCQRFEFRRIAVDVIEKRIREVVEFENKVIEDAAVSLIAKLADGAMRDALSLLEQCFSLGSNISYTDVSSLLGIEKNEVLLQLLKGIIKNDSLDALQTFGEIVDGGKDLGIFFNDFLKINRNLLIAKTNSDCSKLILASDEEIELLQQYAEHISAEAILRNIRVLQDLEKDMKVSSNAKIYFEMSIIKMCKSMENDIEGIYTLIEELRKDVQASGTGNVTSGKQEVDKNIKDEKLDNSNPIIDEDFDYIETEDIIPFEEDEKTVELDEDIVAIDADEDLDNNEVSQQQLDKAIDEIIERMGTVRSDIAKIMDKSYYTLNGNKLCIEVVRKLYKEELELVKETLEAGFSKKLNRDIQIIVELEA